MARTKFTTDYIPTYADIEAAKAQRSELLKNTPDPRHEYKISAFISVLNKTYTTSVWAIDINSAKEDFIQQWGTLGVIPRDVVIVPVENTNIEVK